MASAENEATNSVNDEAAQRLYEQAMENWVNPEIVKRHKKGEFELPLKLFYAQILFGLDGTHTVRLNNEVRGIFKAKLRKAVQKGDPLLIGDVEDIYFTDRAEEDKDFGHITIAQYEDKRSISFSFEYGSGTVRKYLNLGQEFLSSANASLEDSPRVAICLAMTAAENLIKARLAASPQVRLKTKKHSTLIAIFSLFVHENQALKLDKRYLSAHKFFNKYFSDVRYSTDLKLPHKATLKKHLRALQKLALETRAMIIGLESIK